MNKSSEDLYKILELSKNATAEELKSSYRKLSIKWHPDKNPSNREKATEMFQKIANAYNILNDPDKKEIYDKHGQEGLDMFEKGMDPRKGGFGGAFGGPFGNFPFNFPNGGNPFGFPGAGVGPGGPNRQRQITKCGPTVFRLRLSLKELYQGGLYKLRYSYKEGCDPCEGTGSSTKKLETCNDCKGRGAKMLRRQLPNGMIQMMEQPCNTCLGKGQIADSKNICSICQGKTFIEKPKETDFTVYPGMQWKMQIGVEGQGDELRDQIPGDLVVLILPPKTPNDDPTGSESDDEDSNEGEEGEDDQTGSAQTWNKVNANTSNSTDASVNAAEVANTEAEVDDNRSFDNVRTMSKPKRNNGDLIYKFSIPLVDALTGLKYKFVHPGSGDILVIDHPEVIKSGSIYIIPNKGMPNVDQAAIAHRVPLDKMNVTYGRIIIEFDVIFPTKIAKKTAEVLQALLGKGLSDADPNANLGGKVNKPLPNNGKGGKGKGKGLNAATVAATTASNTGPTSPTNLPKPRYVPVNLILHQEEPDRDDEDMEQMGNSGPRMMHAPQCAQQ